MSPLIALEGDVCDGDDLEASIDKLCFELENIHCEHGGLVHDLSGYSIDVTQEMSERLCNFSVLSDKISDAEQHLRFLMDGSDMLRTFESTVQSGLFADLWPSLASSSSTSSTAGGRELGIGCLGTPYGQV